jgi:hypothetical protein
MATAWAVRRCARAKPKEEDEARPGVALDQQENAEKGEYEGAGREPPSMVSPCHERERGEPEETQCPAPPRLVREVGIRHFPQRHETWTEHGHHVACEIRRIGPPTVDCPTDRWSLGFARQARVDGVERIAYSIAAQIPVASPPARATKAMARTRRRSVSGVTESPGGGPRRRKEHGWLDAGRAGARRGEHERFANGPARILPGRTRRRQIVEGRRAVKQWWGRRRARQRAGRGRCTEAAGQGDDRHAGEAAPAPRFDQRIGARSRPTTPGEAACRRE